MAEAQKTPAPISRKKAKKAGREKRKAKLLADKEFAKAFFAARAKRSADRKLAYRKRYAKKAA